jgi:hypothetical protein
MTDKIFVTDQNKLADDVWNALLPKKKKEKTYKEQQEELLKDIFGK